MTDISREPRWPRGTPNVEHGPGGGRWRSAKGWAQEVSRLLRPHGGGRLMTHEQVASYLGRSDYRVTGEATGAGGRTEFREYSDGRRLAYKRVHGFNSETEAENEAAVSLIGHAIGAPVPAVIQDPDYPTGLLMEFIDSAPVTRKRVSRAGAAPVEVPETRADRIMRAQWERGFEALKAPDSEDSYILHLLDGLVGNSDRHPLNVVVRDDGTMVGIDHGLSNFRGIQDHLDWQGAVQRMNRNARTIDDRRDFGAIPPYADRDNLQVSTEGYVQRYWSREALEEARRRIEALRGHISDQRIDAAIQVLDHLIPISGEGTHGLPPIGGR